MTTSNETLPPADEGRRSSEGLGRCRTCRHWDAVKENEYGALPGSGGCKAAKQIWDVTDYAPGEHGQLRLLPEHAGLLCFVVDGSQYAAELVTMCDFGCVMHEAA